MNLSVNGMNAQCVLLVFERISQAQDLSARLLVYGVQCSIACDSEKAIEQVAGDRIDAVLIDLRAQESSDLWRLPKRIKGVRHLPVLGLVSRKTIPAIDGTLGLDDFVVDPCDPREMATRASLVTWRRRNLASDTLIKCGDLVINLDTGEVTLSGGTVPLTFKEYELLKCLASNPGRVFTRETLLDEVWGFDYYGGDRTVDVHIRRLRSKIEDSSHRFIDTIRSIGYRFKKEA